MAACSQQAQKQQLELNLKSAAYQNLPGWGQDDFKNFGPAFSKSCQRISRMPNSKPLKPLQAAGTAAQWKPLCQKFQTLKPSQYQNFFENYFQPFQVLAGDDPQGLFTGYYEASLNGSRTRTDRYNIPLHARPDDLVMVQLGDFREDLKGRRIAGRVVNGKLRPYENREKITHGNWPHHDKVLIWVDSAVDAFFVQIQGSGVVKLQSGGEMRIGYAGQNGHSYYAIGRELIKRRALTKENISMQSIRTWLEHNPAQADEIMNTNKSYVFFKEIKKTGPIGGQGVVLTPKRSLAIDHSLLPYGLPIWLDILQPKLQRLMVAQDTGGAIRGPVRGDVFWGYGAQAEKIAGAMKSSGTYWILLPKN